MNCYTLKIDVINSTTTSNKFEIFRRIQFSNAKIFLCDISSECSAYNRDISVEVVTNSKVFAMYNMHEILMDINLSKF